MRKNIVLACVFAGLTVLSGCVSETEISQAHAVITALPAEVEGCVFLDDVDVDPRLLISQARFEEKLKAAKLGATHVVEVHAYPGIINIHTLGVGLSGRAYRCPLGKGPKVADEQSELALDTTPYEHFLYDRIFGTED